jgi:tetratricopeptide (TPR) repeat protein
MDFGFQGGKNPTTLEQALTLAQKAIALDDAEPSGHMILSAVLVWQQRHEEAIAETRRAIALNPNLADAYHRLADNLIWAGRPAEALEAVQQALRLNPRAPFWYLWDLGVAYSLLGRYAEAIAALQQVLLRNPNHQTAYTVLAGSYLQQWASQLSQDPQTVERALEAAQRAVALNDSVSWAHVTLGYVYLSQQQYEQAVAEMERTVVLNPNLAGSYASLAEVLSRVGRADEALRAAEQALRLKPVVVDGHLSSVGIAYALAGRYAEARAPLQRYLKRYLNDLEAHLALAAVYSELGKEAEARAEAAEVLRLNPSFSLEVHKQRAPIKDSAALERHLTALRKAGLK